ncbi:MAG: glutamate--tRNA ligase [Candidatus Latescibacterota bacterium]|nr:MAG: glutamate--tRNA ligase [Candidatus Latescibacterota bacterium]
MSEQIRVRFAPSPTGYLHVGGARTALFNWLYARKYGGKFLLRIEDTDQQRNTPEALQAILDGLRWLGLQWDEPVVFQSKRLDIYREYCYRLLHQGKAYYCYCSAALLEKKRQQAQRQRKPWKYDGTCRNLSEEQKRRLDAQGVPKSIRFRVPEGVTAFEDLVHGEVSFDNETIGDFVILRSDGQPVYQMAVVVDDALMKISLVLRGDDHLSNTPKQIMLYQALGFPIPQFAHVPQILGPDKKRLSKRHGATSVTQYQKDGFLPEAVVNFLALLGWSPGDNREKMSRQELIEAFSIQGISKKSAVFDEQKLLWLNGEYLRELSSEQLWQPVSKRLVEEGLIDKTLLLEKKQWILRIIDLLKERAKKLSDFVELGRYFFEDPSEYEEKGQRRHWKDEQTAQRLKMLAEELTCLDDFTARRIEEAVRDLARRLGIAAAQLIHPTRLAVSGRSFGPGLFELMEVLGKEAVIRRLRMAVQFLTQKDGP